MNLSEMTQEQLKTEFERRELERLRDTFAGQALVGLLSGYRGDGDVRINGQPMAFEKAAYLIADGMMKERILWKTA